MAPIYEQLVETFYSGSSGGRVNEKKLQQFFARMAQRFLLWGRPEILRAWNRYRTEAAAIEEGALDSLLSFERFMYALRADLGHDDEEMGPGDLLRVFINDLDEHWSDSPDPSEEIGNRGA
jgi:hypothetical protein